MGIDGNVEESPRANGECTKGEHTWKQGEHPKAGGFSPWGRSVTGKFLGVPDYRARAAGEGHCGVRLRRGSFLLGAHMTPQDGAFGGAAEPMAKSLRAPPELTAMLRGRVLHAGIPKKPAESPRLPIRNPSVRGADERRSEAGHARRQHGTQC